MLDALSQERLLGWRTAFAHPATVTMTAVIMGSLVLAPLAIVVLNWLGKLDPKLRSDLWVRLRSWMVLVPLMLIPVLAGAAWTVIGTATLSLLCYREYARATGLFRERVMSAVVAAGILAVNFAALDHWYGFFTALFPLTVCVLAAVGILADRPKGYIQRVALAIFAFVFFGAGLGHVSFLANDAAYRPMILLLLVTVELNDVFAYCTGKAFGARKLCVNTSPNKTIAGAAGAVVLTTAATVALGRVVFRGDEVGAWPHLIGLGVLISVSGQFGDLMLSSIKRDIGVKDLGALIPGHGGLLDRFDSLILAAPTVFHYIMYFRGIGAGQPERILTG